MKSKSFQSINDHQELQIYPATSQQQQQQQQHQTRLESPQHRQNQQSFTQHRIYHLSDDKINDIIFIEETPKIKVLTSKKILHESNHLQKFALNRSTNNITSSILPSTTTLTTSNTVETISNEPAINNNEMKFNNNYISTSSNQLYQDQQHQSSLLTVYSTTASNLALKIPQQSSSPQHSFNQNGFRIYSKSSKLAKAISPTHFQQQSSSTILNSPTKQLNMIERSSSNSKYPNIHSSTSNRNNSQLSSEIKKFIPGRSILNQSGSPTPSIVSIVKPIISNVFIAKDVPNSAGLNNNSNNNNTNNKQTSPTIMTRLNKGQILRTNTDRSPTALLSPVLYHQQILTASSPQQQNLYNITSNNNSNNNITTTNNNDIYSQATKTPLNRNSTKSPNVLTREKTSLSNYFTNIMNHNNNVNTNPSNTININKKSSNNNNNNNNSSKQVFNSTITNNLIGKVNNSSRNELNSSLSSNNVANINSMLISFNKPNTAKHSNSFNYKFPTSTNNTNVATPSSPNRTNNNNFTFDNDILAGVSLKSATGLKIQKYNSNNSINDLNNSNMNQTLNNNNRNDSRLLEAVIHEMNDGQDSLLETANEEGENGFGNNGAPSGRSNKYLNNKKITKSKPVDKHSLVKQATHTSNVSSNNYQTLMISSRRLNMDDENVKQPTFDESLNFDNTNNLNNDDDKNGRYSSNRNLARNSRSSFKETSTKIFGSIIMPSKSTLLTNNTINNNQQTTTNKRHDSAKSYISRDINDSYAYNDVKKYIEENELMPPDRAEFIRLWIRDVNMCLKDLEQTVT